MKEELRKTIESNFNAYMPLLMEAFVTYYGEEYRNIIQKKLNGLRISFYIGDFLKANNLIKNQNYKSKKEFYLSISKELELNSQKSKIIYSSFDENSLSETEKNFLYETIKINTTAQKTDIINGKKTNDIIIQLLVSGDRELIHEIIHSLVREITLTKTQGIVLDKFGLSVGYSDYNKPSDHNHYPEEVVTDIEAEQIFKIFRSMGGKIIEQYNCPDKIDDGYLSFRYLLDEFYNTFKDEIIRARLLIDRDYLLNLLDQERFINFYNYINEIIANKDIRGIKRYGQIEFIRDYIEGMKRHKERILTEQIFVQEEKKSEAKL